MHGAVGAEFQEAIEIARASSPTCGFRISNCRAAAGNSFEP
jgi:hypothetical protein